MALASLAGFPALAAYSQTARDLAVRAGKQMENPRFPKGYAVVIGVATYRNLPVELELKFPESDAEAFYRTLIDRERGGFEAQNVHLLLGKKATLATIRQEIEVWLPEVAGPDDRVIVYFAGHGYVDGGRGYLAPWDIDLEGVGQTGYAMKSIADVFSSKVKASWKALFIDACHSGRMNAESVNESVSRELDTAFSKTEYLAFVSTLGKQSSYEDKQLATGFGLFTYFLIEGIKGAAEEKPCDGWIRAGELVEYVRREVRQYAKDRGQEQTPYYSSDFDPNMIFGRAGGVCEDVDIKGSGTLKITVNLPETVVWVDDRLAGTASPGAELSLPGLTPGDHVVRACRQGYECDIRKILILPGQTLAVSVRIHFIERPNHAAVSSTERAARLLYTKRSTVNPLAVIPIARSQSRADLLKAASLFEAVTREDDTYAPAAYHLGVAYQLLGNDKASKAAFETAIKLDPADSYSRVHYAGKLIESGDPDEAIRQLSAAIQLDKTNAEAHSLIARAFLDKEEWDRCVESASESIHLNSGQQTAYLWKADCQRQLGVKTQSRAAFQAASTNYSTFLKLTDYGTPAAQWFAYHFIGFHLGGVHHADRKVSFDLLRAAGLLGMCISERNLGHEMLAKRYCQRATALDPKDPMGHFVSGLASIGSFNKTNQCGDLTDAISSFRKLLSLNSKIQEARHAPHYIEEAESFGRQLRCSR